MQDDCFAPGKGQQRIAEPIIGNHDVPCGNRLPAGIAQIRHVKLVSAAIQGVRVAASKQSVMPGAAVNQIVGIGPGDSVIARVAKQGIAPLSILIGAIYRVSCPCTPITVS